MLKTVCPRCGLVNLDRFVTFPHCAGCDALLPAAPVASVWQRSLNAPLWATLIGLCCAGVGVVGLSIARETRPTEQRALVVYGQMPQQIELRQLCAVQLTLDTTDSQPSSGGLSSRGAPLEDVRLRVPRAVREAFVLTMVSPPSETRAATGSGHYFIWSQLPRNQTLRVWLRPRRAGTQRVALSLFVRDYKPFEFRAWVRVKGTPAPRVSTPKIGH